jgi:uncharacterized Zn finger protein
MEEFIFLVQGSAKEPYKVTFQKRENNLTAYCTCPAGDNGQFCKHRFNILEGIADDIVSGNESEVQKVTSWLSETGVEVALNNVLNAEDQLKIAKQKLSVAKKHLARILRHP